MHKYVLIILFFLICFSNTYAQDKDTALKYKTQVLDGYFILLRDSIAKTDEDVTLPILQFTTFYVAAIDNNILESLKVNNLPSNDSITLISGGTNYAIADSKENTEYINWLIANKYFEQADKGTPLFDNMQIPSLLVRNEKRFISVYKGKCRVVGPFYPYNKINIKNQKLYMYLPVKENYTEYLYSLLF